MALKQRIQMRVTIAELAQRLGAEVVGPDADRSRALTGIQPVEAAGQGEVTFVTDARHAAAVAKSGAAAVIVARPVAGLPKLQLVVKDVNAALIETLNVFAPQLTPAAPGVDPSARVGRDVHLADDVSIGPHVVLDDHVRIGARSVIAAGCRIGENTRIARSASTSSFRPTAPSGPSGSATSFSTVCTGSFPTTAGSLLRTSWRLGPTPALTGRNSAIP
jgi:UDP-3-O-[3-hydroxymyristoyl] glucosamine N-acyltransferase